MHFSVSLSLLRRAAPFVGRHSDVRGQHWSVQLFWWLWELPGWQHQQYLEFGASTPPGRRSGPPHGSAPSFPFPPGGCALPLPYKPHPSCLLSLLPIVGKLLGSQLKIHEKTCCSSDLENLVVLACHRCGCRYHL